MSSAGATGTSLALTGSLANINAALARGVSYTPTAAFTGTTTITVYSLDHGNAGRGGGLSDIDSTTITWAVQNKPPVNTLPALVSTNNRTPILFAASDRNTLSFADSDGNATATNYSVRLSSLRANCRSLTRRSASSARAPRRRRWS